MKKSITMFCSLFLVTLNVHAWPDIRISPPRIDWPSIPPVKEIIDSAQNALPISPHSVECEKVRSDAVTHQKRLNQAISGFLYSQSQNSDEMKKALDMKAITSSPFA